jgi:hypothetical protein
MPFTQTPDYNLSQEYLPEKPLAIGPGWRQNGAWRDLAECSANLTAEITPVIDRPDRQQLSVEYRHGGTVIHEQYDLTAGKVRLRAVVTPACAVRLRVPLLAGDGEQASSLHFEGSTVRLEYRGFAYVVTYEPGTQAVLDLHQNGNRNGVYRTLVLEKAGQEIQVELEITPIEGR